MNGLEFESRIIFQRSKFINNLSKILEIDGSRIERLKPKQTTQGILRGTQTNK